MLTRCSVSVCFFSPVTASMFFAVAVFCAKILKILFKKEKKEEKKTEQKTGLRNRETKKRDKTGAKQFCGRAATVWVTGGGKKKKFYLKFFESISFVTMPLNLQKILSSAQICSIFLYDTKKNASGRSRNNISVCTGTSQVTAAMWRRASANQNPEERKKKTHKNLLKIPHCGKKKSYSRPRPRLLLLHFSTKKKC